MRAKGLGLVLVKILGGFGRERERGGQSDRGHMEVERKIG